MNPTTAEFNIKDSGKSGERVNSIPDITDVEKQEQGKVRWNARDYRKGSLDKIYFDASAS